MGQIQNAISGLVTTAIGAGVAKDIKETKEKAAFAEAVKLKPELEEELAKSETEINTTKDEIEQLKKDNIPQGDGYYVPNLFGKDLAPEISKRELSLRTLAGKQEARRIQVKDYTNVIENYRKKRGIQ